MKPKPAAFGRRPFPTQRVGHGLFSWPRAERVTDRYGGFGLYRFDGDVKVVPSMDMDLVNPMVGKRVHVVCRVVESRQSHHIGDLCYGVGPTRPSVGEYVSLGVGTLRLDRSEDWPCPNALLLEPDDRRDQWWVDPQKLYHLHDQTVDVFMEVTDEPFSPSPIPTKKVRKR